MRKEKRQVICKLQFNLLSKSLSQYMKVSRYFPQKSKKLVNTKCRISLEQITRAEITKEEKNEEVKRNN